MIRRIGKYLINVAEEINRDNYFKREISFIEPAFVYIHASELNLTTAKTLRYSTSEKEIKMVLERLAKEREHDLQDLKSIIYL